MPAKNPTVSQAARTRAADTIKAMDSDIIEAEGLVKTKLELGEFAGHIQHILTTRTAKREGYVEALRDLLPERTVDSIVGGDDDEGGAQG